MLLNVGMVCPPVRGHLNPMLTLGRELTRRGHQVFVVVPRHVRHLVEQAGLTALLVGEPEEMRGELQAEMARLGELSGVRAMLQTSRLLHTAVAIMLRDVPRMLHEAHISALFVDQFSPAAAIVAEQMHLPYVVCCNALASQMDVAVPPPSTGFRYRTGITARWRNRAACLAARWLFSLHGGKSETEGVSPLLLLLEPERYGLALLAQQPAFFDLPPARLPDHFHYTAPWHILKRDDSVAFPWEWLDERPLIYASLGTLQNRLRHIYAAIARAVDGLPVQLVLSLGDPAAMHTMPPQENVLAVPFVPQMRLLERAVLAITHAGLNTALECLSSGTPMICLPITNDQPGVARRVEWLGLGEVLRPTCATPARIRAAIIRVLNQASYSERSRRVKQQLAALQGPNMACDIAEEAFLSRRRILSPPTR